jgi:hypothetical protein
MRWPVSGRTGEMLPQTLDRCCNQAWLLKKGAKAVISVNFSVYGRRKLNNLRTTFAYEIP